MEKIPFYSGKESMKAMSKKDKTYDIFFKPKQVKQKFYRDRLALGFDADRFFYEGIKKPIRARLNESAFHTIVLGKTGCLPKGTMIKTPNGKKPIEEINEVLSYNFKTEKIEPKHATISNSGYKKIIKIHTEMGVIECSPEHRWFVEKNGKIIIKKAIFLNKKDKLLLIGESVDDYEKI